MKNSVVLERSSSEKQINIPNFSKSIYFKSGAQSLNLQESGLMMKKPTIFSRKFYLIFLINRIMKTEIKRAFYMIQLSKTQMFTLELLNTHCHRSRIHAFNQILSYSQRKQEQQTCIPLETITICIVRVINKIGVKKKKEGFSKILKFNQRRKQVFKFSREIEEICFKKITKAMVELAFQSIQIEANKVHIRLKQLDKLIKFLELKYKKIKILAFYSVLKESSMSPYEKLMAEKERLKKKWNEINCKQSTIVFENRKQLREIKRSFEHSAIQKQQSLRSAKSGLNIHKTKLKILKKNCNQQQQAFLDVYNQNKACLQKLMGELKRIEHFRQESKGKKERLRKIYHRIEVMRGYKDGEVDLIDKSLILEIMKGTNIRQLELFGQFHLYKNSHMRTLLSAYQNKKRDNSLDCEQIEMIVKEQNKKLKELMKIIALKYFSSAPE